MSLTKEQIAFRREWSAALRSEKYKQGRFYLRDHGRYCVSGVACDLSSPGRRPGLFDWAIEVTAHSGFTMSDRVALERENDRTNGQTFLELADTIELLTLADMEGTP